ncbi:hypothetical protein [Arenibacter algicola]|uniref:Lipoprotein n=1 Tax=Arenibacter algicola TaxID=616991 RepID=A0A221USA6_9FLAO|nr:hypothetical protein [Arenibacter algicola]ASO03986.1 hypothetical protein AREALGSMS7_00497 [Arenibacter algicola]
MKNLFNTIIILTLLFSCGETVKKTEDRAENLTEIDPQNKEKTVANRGDNTTYLCKINGEDWGYTSADGLVSRNSSTNKRTATITFIKKLEKGSESIQLEYNVDANTLTRVLAELKRPDKDGNLFTNFYNQSADRLDRNPEASMSGTVTLSEDQRVVAGNALFTVQNDFEKDKLGNKGDLLITVSDLNFSGVSYSDTDDLKKLFKK